MSDDLKKKALEYSSTPKMTINIESELSSKDDLSLAYTPGIAEVCKEIQKDNAYLLKLAKKHYF